MSTSDGGIVTKVKNCPVNTVKAIDYLHHKWLLDSEIAERLNMIPLEVWHVRQANNINRHNPAPIHV